MGGKVIYCKEKTAILLRVQGRLVLERYLCDGPLIRKNGFLLQL
jgi:hypothetical protein